MRCGSFFKDNTFRVKIGANSPALGGDMGTWGLGVGLGDNLYEIWGQLFWFWGLAQGDLGGTWLGTTSVGLGEHIFGFGRWGQGELGFWGGTWGQPVWGKPFLVLGGLGF